MQEGTTETPEQAQAALDIVCGLFGDSLRAVYLHGSAVCGGLSPQSDIDLLVVIDRPMTEAVHRRLAAAVLEKSGRHPARPGGPRCLEVIVFATSALAAPGFPARAEFIYGEWLREALEAGEIPMPVSDPELTLVLAQARQEARPLFGPLPPALLPEIPAQDIRRAMRAALPALLAGFRGDERNVLLTLARMWRTAATGDFVSKDAAAAWAASRLPQAAQVLLYARSAYLGEVKDDWQTGQADAQRAAQDLGERVAALV